MGSGTGRAGSHECIWALAWGGFRTAGSFWWGCAEGEERGAFIAAGFGLCPLALSPPGTVTPWHCHPLALLLLVLRIHHHGGSFLALVLGGVGEGR